MTRYINDYKTYILNKGQPWSGARKVTLDAGFTCPNIDGTKARGGCVYCSNAAFSPAFRFRHMSITEQLNKNIPFLKPRYKVDKFFAYFQAFTNTYAPVAVLREKYEEALAHPDVIGLAIGTRPDCLNEENIALLVEIGRRAPVYLEIGLQSANDETLIRINRHHTFQQFVDVMGLLKDQPIEVCLHMIIGLPGETHNDFIQTAKALRPFNYHSIKIHPIYVVTGTRLEKEFLNGNYKPLEMSEYVEALADYLEYIPFHVAIERLHSSAPKQFFIGPAWCKNAQGLTEQVCEIFKKRGTKQGYHVD